MAKTAKFQKLYNGQWGIRVRGKVKVGDEIEVKNRRGQVQDKTVASIEWTDGDETVCAIELDESELDDAEDEPEIKASKRTKRAGKVKRAKTADYVLRDIKRLLKGS